LHSVYITTNHTMSTTNSQKVTRISGDIKIRAKPTPEDLRDLLWDFYRLRVVDKNEEAGQHIPIKELDSYLDSNFLVTGEKLSNYSNDNINITINLNFCLFLHNKYFSPRTFERLKKVNFDTSSTNRL